MTVILCIDPSPAFGAIVAQIAEKIGSGIRLCRGFQEAMDVLEKPQDYTLMVVSNQIDDESSGIDLIRNARLFIHRVMMPVIFVMSDRDLDIAIAAMRAGATDVVLRSDIRTLAGLVGEHVDSCEDVVPSFIGHALLVEDSESQADYIEQLCNMVGLRVDRCNSVEDGIFLLKKADYQLAVVDIVLKGVGSGLELVRHIRRQPGSRSRMPVLVMTSFDDKVRRRAALRLGADDFLDKPFSECEFVWRLQRIMQMHTSYNFSRARSQELMDWQQLGLSPREGEICEAMVRGATDKQIAADLRISYWTVRTHVSNIFAKLGVLNRQELITQCLPRSEPGK